MTHSQGRKFFTWIAAGVAFFFCMLSFFVVFAQDEDAAVAAEDQQVEAAVNGEVPVENEIKEEALPEEKIEELPAEEAPVENLEQPVEAVKVEEAPGEEAVAEEKPVVEEAVEPEEKGVPQPEPAAEEKPAETVEEVAVEEKPVEAAVTEEKPVEEAVVEEKPVEEAVVEEKPAEAVEEAAAEEKPAEEALAEEKPVEEVAAEEKPAEAVEEVAVEEKPVEAVEEVAAEEKPAEEAVAEEKPVEEVAVEEKPAETVEEVAAEEKPAEEAVAEEKPVEAVEEVAGEEKPAEAVEEVAAVEKPAEGAAGEEGAVAATEEQPADLDEVVNKAMEDALSTKVEQPPENVVPGRGLEDNVSVLSDQEILRRKAFEQHGVDSYKSGKEAMEKRDYTKAAQFFQESMRYTGRRPETKDVFVNARRGLSECYFQQALLKKSEAQYDAAIDFAKSAVVHGHPKASKLMEDIKVERERKQKPPPVAPKVTTRRKDRDYIESQQEIETRLLKGRQFFQTGEYEKARDKFEEVLKRDPENTEAIRMMEKVGRILNDRSTMELEATRKNMIADVRDT